MYALIDNGAVAKYPYSASQLRRDNPQTSFPQFPTDAMLEDFGVFQVMSSTRPPFDAATQKVVEITPVFTGAKWEQAWEVIPLTADELQSAALALQADIVAQTQARLDDFARTRNYDGILSACTYATSSVPKFQAEGQYAVTARDDTWATLYTLMDDVHAGNWQMPTSFADVEPILPQLTWPL